MYDYVIVTHIPNFYKVNLYNELAKKFKILVIFTASDTNQKRSDDFIAIKNLNFDYKLLFKGDYEDRDVRANIMSLRHIFRTHQYRKILVSGWDTKEDWYSVIKNNKLKNCLALESTINESDTSGIKGIMKRIFLSRISKTFASGMLHKNLLDQLKYKGEVVITKGVGIINKPEKNLITRDYEKKFLFIGRLSKEKNVEFLINLFNSLEEYRLVIIGTGPLYQELKKKAKSNIIFKGHVANEKLKKYFETNNIIMLPSISETWGLVIEEALYFGMPVMVSKNCGVRELIQDGVNGYICDFTSTKNIIDTISTINDSNYQKLLRGVSDFSLNKKDLQQVKSYDIK